jgi:hypothetical protein
MRSNSRDHDSHGHTIFLENQLRTVEVCQRDLYKKKGKSEFARLCSACAWLVGETLKFGG